MRPTAQQMQERLAWRSLAAVALPALALLPLLAARHAVQDAPTGGGPPLFTMAEEPALRPKAAPPLPAEPTAAPPAPQMEPCVLPPQPQIVEIGPLPCGFDSRTDGECELAIASLPTPPQAAQPRPRALPQKPAATATATTATSSTPPAYLSNPKPPYPDSMRRRRIQGSVGVRIAVSPQGAPTAVDITSPSGHSEFDSAARSWILRHWRFRPATRSGQATASTVNTTVRFKLD